MTGISEIQRAILSLPESEYAKLREWLVEKDWERWDRQIEADSKAGGSTSWLSRLMKPRKVVRLEISSAPGYAGVLETPRTLAFVHSEDGLSKV